MQVKHVSKLCLTLAVLHLQEKYSEGQTLLPVWQWIDPQVPGITWPADRPQGEVKACTCAHVDKNQQCLDSDARGLRSSFACGLLNFRNRAGNDETVPGMRPIEPCYCSYNQGRMNQSFPCARDRFS